MALINIEVNIDDRVIAKKLNFIANDACMLEIHNLLAKMCDPYVPFLEGPLSQTHTVTPKGVTYIQPYARYQYYGVNFNHTKEYHPLASAMWDKAMLDDHGDEFLAQVKEILIRRAKQNG